MGKEIRSVSFDVEGTLLAVGFKDGQISLVSFSMEKKELIDLAKTRERNAPITCVRYSIKTIDLIKNQRFSFSIFRFSPNRKYLVASSENCSVDFFDIQQEKLTRDGYVTHIADPVLQMDWSTSSKYIRVREYFEVLFEIQRDLL
jgi:WD40 repeat protein